MKLRCFPKIIEAAESAIGSLWNGSRSQITSLANVSVNQLLHSMLGGQGAAASLIAAMNAITGEGLEPEGGEKKMAERERQRTKIRCRLCETQVANEERSKTEHLKRHAAEAEWHCSECGFGSFVQADVREHAELAHCGSSAQPIRFGLASQGTNQISSDEQRKLCRDCFPDAPAPAPALAPVSKANCQSPAFPDEKSDDGALLLLEDAGEAEGECEGDDEDDIDSETTGGTGTPGLPRKTGPGANDGPR